MLDRCLGPAGLLAAAAMIAVIYGASDLLGLGHLTSSLSGTLPATPGALLLGLGYVAGWFSFILLAPIFTIAAVIQLAYSWRRAMSSVKAESWLAPKNQGSKSSGSDSLTVD